jgi:hypothetical protein
MAVEATQRFLGRHRPEDDRCSRIEVADRFELNSHRRALAGFLGYYAGKLRQRGGGLPGKDQRDVGRDDIVVGIKPFSKRRDIPLTRCGR